MPTTRYQPYDVEVQDFHLPDRTWPDKRITTAPLWCAVDLRDTVWEVPYLPIDPKDVGRTYEAVIRVNSQSGKGGVAYIMKTDHGINMPKAMQPEFSAIVQSITDSEGGEVNSKNMWDIFAGTYLDLEAPLELIDYEVTGAVAEDEDSAVVAQVEYDGQRREIRGTGNGPIAAFAQALEALGIDFEVQDYSQRSRTAGDDADAACYIYANVDGANAWGVGIAGSTTRASLKAIVSAVNRGLTKEQTSGV